MAELYTRLEKYKLKQETDRNPTHNTKKAIRTCRNRIQTLLEEVGGVEDRRIPVEDARPLVEYFSGIRNLPEFSEDEGKAALLFRAMQIIFRFGVSVTTLAKYYYSKDKELLYEVLNIKNKTSRK